MAAIVRRRDGRGRRRLLVHALADAFRLRQPSRAQPPGSRPASSSAWSPPRARPGAADRSPTCRCSAVGGITPDDEALLVRLSLSSRHAGRHPGPRRAIEGRRADGRVGQRQAVRRRSHRPGRGGVLARDVEAVQPHVQPRRRHDDVRGRARVQSHVHRRRGGRRSASRCSAIQPSATRSGTRSRTRTAIPAKGADACRRRTGTCVHVNKVSRPENEKYVGRSLTDIAAELGVHPDRRDARHRAVRGPHDRVPLAHGDAGVDRRHARWRRPTRTCSSARVTAAPTSTVTTAPRRTATS